MVAIFSKRTSTLLVFSLMLTVSVSPILFADEKVDGRKLYINTCLKCHGEITEHRLSKQSGKLFIQVVALPLGPNLTGIYGRPAGTILGFRYSNAFRNAAKNLVWDEATLDRWLTDSQAMIRGSYMILKVKESARSKIIQYLKAYSPYRD